ALLDDPNLVLADIRDAERVDEVFDRYRPDVVFHCAALKHLTLLERFPREAWLTNVVGTVNLLRVAQRTGVTSFVNISTDKAADPTSVLGSSKRITERLTAHVAAETGAQYVSVRFGNVLGSRGSVLTIFKRQAELGGPITVTDPGVTRYFMTVQEATRLTAFAGAIGQPGEVLVLDMGAPIRIADVARRFARQGVPELPVVFTGLRAGEKLHESLFADDEADLRPVHPHVSHVPVTPLSPANLDSDLGLFEDSVVGARYVNVVATS
ncbi:MAG: polysaccharide biosynthesis protein, partial [Actinomycetota bacterium]